MKASRVFPLLSTVALLAGCDSLLSTDVTFTDDAAAAVELAIDITGDCGDRGERTDERGVTRWTETLIGEGEAAQCQIEVTWDGELISLAQMRADAVEECGPGGDHCDPDTLALTLGIRLEDAWFDAGAERLERAQLVAMTGRATTGGALLFQLDRETPLPIDLTADPAVATQLTAAYRAAAALPVHAEATLVLTMADVRRLQAVAPEGVLHVAFTSRLSGTIAAHL